MVSVDRMVDICNVGHAIPSKKILHILVQDLGYLGQDMRLLVKIQDSWSRFKILGQDSRFLVKIQDSWSRCYPRYFSALRLPLKFVR